MREVRRGPHALYKGQFFITFYTLDDEFVTMFDNVREILQYQHKEVTRQAVNLLNVELCRALRSENHYTRMLTGETMKVYAVNPDDED